MTLLPSITALGPKPDPAVVCPPCGKCCSYVSVGIDPPSNVGRVSTTLWLLYHPGVAVYQSHEGDWFLLVPSRCDNLRADGLCGVYENRPFLCREYDVDGCEGTSEESAEKVRFDDAKTFLRWLRKNRAGLFKRSLEAGIIPERFAPEG